MTGQSTRGASRSRVRSLWFGVAAAIIVSVGVTALSRTGSASAGGEPPMVSPDRLDDTPLTAGEAFPVVGNFAWRAFIALNWPSRPLADERGVPDRAKSLGDPGKRVWETFKS